MAETVQIARDWALILLAIEGLVLFALPLYLFLRATKGLGRLLPLVQRFLWRVRLGANRVERGALHGAEAVSRPFVAIQSASAAVRAFCVAYRRRRS